jgi:hypothetical protein
MVLTPDQVQELARNPEIWFQQRRINSHMVDCRRRAKPDDQLKIQVAMEGFKQDDATVKELMALYTEAGWTVRTGAHEPNYWYLEFIPRTS